MANQLAYYVAPTGSDTNPGTVSAPFQTLGKARDTVRTINASMTQDIYVYLRGGTYPITSTVAFGPSDSGTNGHRIYYEAFPGRDAGPERRHAGDGLDGVRAASTRRPCNARRSCETSTSTTRGRR